MAVFRELVDAGDENLLVAGNHTGCETVEVLKKAGADYRKKMEIDENIFMECRIIGDTYRIEDNESEHTKGKPIIYLEKTFIYFFSKDTCMLLERCHFVYIYILKNKSSVM